MRNYTPDKYNQLVEASQDQGLQTYMKQEAAFITATPDASRRTFVDLGAGYGRAVPTLANTAHNVIAIEINPDMHAELQRFSQNYTNVSVIAGDFNDLSDLLADFELIRPVFLILQNTLGTVEGDYHETIRSMRQCAEHECGELVISLFRQPALEKWGLSMYASIASMIGQYDPAKSDLQQGIFRTETGYMSHWWTNQDIKELIKETGGRLAMRCQEENFCLLRIAY